jgi:adenylate cyclase
MDVPGPERRLAAVLAADMVGFSRLMEVDETGTLARLKTHRIELIDPAIAKNRGRIIKTTGDGMLVEFHSIVDAVLCAAEIQRRMARRNADVAPARWIQFRIGINLGDVIVENDDIFGDGVNVAARLEMLAEPGGICVSSAVRDQIGQRLEDIEFEDLGDQSVRTSHVRSVSFESGSSRSQNPRQRPPRILRSRQRPPKSRRSPCCRSPT